MLFSKFNFNFMTSPGIDTTAPTVAIACAQSSPSAASPLNFTFTLSEPSVDFAVGDITAAITGGTVTKSNFAGSGTSYTCDLAPSVAGVMTVDVAAGAFHDGAGNGNLAATQFTITVIVLSLLDQFTTDDASPITTPRTCEPGPGTLAITDTTSKASIAGSKLVWTGRVGNNDPMIATASALYARQIGLSISMKCDSAKEQGMKFTPTSAGTAPNAAHDGAFFTGSSLRVGDAGAIARGATVTGATPIYLVCRTNGNHVIQDASGTKSLLFTYYKTTQVLTTNLFAVCGVVNNNVAGEADNLTVALLPAPWNTDTGIATNVSASPASNDELAHTADGAVEVEWVATTSATVEVWVRRTDADNGWIIRGDQGGSTIKIIEKNAGVETERASAAMTWTNATKYRIYVVFFSNSIYTYTATATSQDTNKNSYTSASFNNTATIGKVVASAGALTNFITWPRVLSGTALTILQTAFP